MIRKTIGLVSIVAVNVLVTAPLFAQDDVWRFYNIKDSVVVEAERVTQIPTYHSIATKIPVSLLSTPASIGVVTNALFDSQDGTVLGDALKNVSGINVQSNFGVHDYFLIRGFDSLNNGLVLTDGTAEPEATFYNLYNIERVEVLKGPSAFLYGGNPLSGTVNLVRKKPSLSNFTNVSTSYGSFSTFRGTLDFNRVDTQAGLAFRLNGLYQRSDNYRDDKENKSYAVNPALTWQLGARSAVTFNFEYTRNQYMPDSGLPLMLQGDPINGFFLEEASGVSRKTSYQSPFDLSDQSLYRAQIVFNSRINNAISLQNKTYFTDMKWDSRGTFILGAFPNPVTFQVEVQRNFLDLDDRQKLIGNQLEGIFTFKTGSIEHLLLTGFEYIRYSDEFTLNFAPLPPMNLNDPVETATEPLTFFPAPPLPAGEAHSDVFAPYFVDKIAFLDKCTVFLGGRFDVIDYVDDLSKVKRDYEKFSPMFGFGYMPTDGLSFYGNVGRSFAPPSTRAIGDLKPEESVQYEVGAKQKLLDGKLNATLAVYQLEKENIAIPDDNGLTQQNGNQRSRGVEFELKAQPVKGLLAFLAYSYTDAELTEFSELVNVGSDMNPSFLTIDRSGNQSAFVPKHILNVWFTKELQYGIGVGGGGRYLSSQFIAQDNAFKLDSSIILDAAIFFRSDNWKCSLNFKNLTNRERELRGFSIILPPGVPGGSVIPAKPFAVYTEIELSM